MSVTKFSVEETEQLYEVALEQGWDALDQSERIAVGRWCRKTGRKRPDIAPSAPSEPSRPVTEAEAPAAGAAKAVGAVRADDDEDLRLLRCVDFVERFPDDIVVDKTHDWSDISAALRRFPKPARVASDMSRRRASELRRVIRKGRTASWRPSGSFRAEIAPDHEHEGRWAVYAQHLDDLDDHE